MNLILRETASFVVGLFLCARSQSVAFRFLQQLLNSLNIFFRVSVVHFYTPELMCSMQLEFQTLLEVGVLLQESVDFLNLPSECSSFFIWMVSTLR